MDLYDNYERVDFPTVGEIVLYTVRRGDNLFRIARRFNTELAWILAMNNLNRNSMIFPNQQLLIPIVFQKPVPLPMPQPRPPMPRNEDSSLERNDYDMYF